MFRSTSGSSTKLKKRCAKRSGRLEAKRRVAANIAAGVQSCRCSPVRRSHNSRGCLSIYLRASEEENLFPVPAAQQQRVRLLHKTRYCWRFGCVYSVGMILKAFGSWPDRWLASTLPTPLYTLITCTGP